jgi:hypothetical protein
MDFPVSPAFSILGIDDQSMGVNGISIKKDLETEGFR